MHPNRAIRRLLMERAGRTDVLKMCVNKVPYFTRKMALDVMATRQDDGAGYLREYECPHCGQWHLTSLHEGKDMTA